MKTPSPDPSPVQQEPGKKKRWEAPTIQTGQLFETNSLACPKATFDGVCEQGGEFKS